MKFGEQLFTRSAPEWRKQYIQYQEMKTMLYNAFKMAPFCLTLNVADIPLATNCDSHFFNFCRVELFKINHFYKEKLTEATTTLAKLQHQIQTNRQNNERTKSHKTVTKVRSILTASFKSRGAPPPSRKSSLTKFTHEKEVQVSTTKKIDLNLAFSEFYLSLVLLKNYVQLNYAGFQKICKKHDKLFGTNVGAIWFTENVPSAPFYTDKSTQALIQKTEQIVTYELQGGNRERAMKNLRVRRNTFPQSLWTTYKLGFFSGILLVLIIVLVLTGVYDWTTCCVDWGFVLRLYRGALLLIFFTFSLGINIYIWRTTGVNHVLIFELDPRNHLSEQHLIELAIFFGSIWSLSVLSFLYSSNDGPLNVPPYINPFLLGTFIILFMFNPFNVCSKTSRYWVLSILGRIAGAPFFEVKFADFWLADQLNSLVYVLLDFQYSICLYVTGHGDVPTTIPAYSGSCIVEGNSLWIRSVLSCLPAWFRFAQCLRRYRDTREAFPHLANAAKYSTTIFVAIFANLHANFEGDDTGPFFVVWTFALVINSMYGLVWDIRMDWGLFEKTPGVKGRHFLRAERVYSIPLVYYLATIQNIILRFSWILSYSLVYLEIIRTDSMLSISAGLEIYRRFIWNFFRLENEHLSNCGKFRAVRDISLSHLSHPHKIFASGEDDSERSGLGSGSGGLKLV